MNEPSCVSTKMCLGEKIKLYRERARVSQFSLEIEAGMQPGSICRIERGVINPNKETIFKLAKALNLTSLEIADLFEIDLVKFLPANSQEAQEEKSV